MHDAPHVIFGLDPLWVSTALLLMTYAVIMTEKVNRAVVALLGAGLMICLGVLNQEAAIRGVDFNTIALLTGMMILVNITRKCGVFQYVAFWSAKVAKRHDRVLVAHDDISEALQLFTPYSPD